MKYCQKCGQSIMDEAVICPHCGCPVGSQTPSTNASSGGSAGWAVLGFFLPVVGLILYLVWKNTRPADAKTAGKGALIGFIVNIVLGVIIVVIEVLIVGSAMSSLSALSRVVLALNCI